MTASLKSLPSEFSAALKSFASSPSTFQILRTVSSRSSSAATHSQDAAYGHAVTDSKTASRLPERLYILDSSFNPPTLGHLSIALSALRSEAGQAKHILLLLATVNADKPSKPAPFEQRLTMMTILASTIITELSKPRSSPSSGHTSPPPAYQRIGERRSESIADEVTVDIAVTKNPYFIDKSNALAAPPEGTLSYYPFPPTQQVHLVGFDTFTRLLDAQYYPPNHTLEPLTPLFSNHRLRITYRIGEEYGDREAQNGYLEALRTGEREKEGGKREWAKKVEMVEGRNEESITSSTKARDAVKQRNRKEVERMCGLEVGGWVWEEGLYREEDERP